MLNDNSETHRRSKSYIAEESFQKSVEENTLGMDPRAESVRSLYHSPDGYFRIEYATQQSNGSAPCRHVHNFFEIYTLLAGTCLYYIRGRTYLLRANDLVLVRPGAYHRTMDTGQGMHDYLMFHFDRSYFNNEPTIAGFVDELFSTPRLVIRPALRERAELQGLIRRLLNELHRIDDEPEGGLMFSAFVRAMLALIHRAAEGSEIEPEETELHSDPRIAELVEYLNENFRENLTVAELAERFYLSRYHLSRKFKEATGFTILEYLNSIRVIEAQEMLVHTDYRIGELVDLVGFGSSSQFTRIFKSITGMTPSRYRREQRMQRRELGGSAPPTDNRSI